MNLRNLDLIHADYEAARRREDPFSIAVATSAMAEEALKLLRLLDPPPLETPQRGPLCVCCGFPFKPHGTEHVCEACCQLAEAVS